MPKFKAPANVSDIALSIGPVPVEDGSLEIHNPNLGDLAALRANGFELIATGAYFAPVAPEPAPEPDEAPEAPPPPADAPETGSKSK